MEALRAELGGEDSVSAHRSGPGSLVYELHDSGLASIGEELRARVATRDRSDG